VWAVPGRFFQSLPVPYGASPDVTSPDVTDSRESVTVSEGHGHPLV